MLTCSFETSENSAKINIYQILEKWFFAYITVFRSQYAIICHYTAGNGSLNIVLTFSNVSCISKKVKVKIFKNIDFGCKKLALNRPKGIFFAPKINIFQKFYFNLLRYVGNVRES